MIYRKIQHHIVNLNMQNIQVFEKNMFMISKRKTVIKKNDRI